MNIQCLNMFIYTVQSIYCCMYTVVKYLRNKPLTSINTVIITPRAAILRTICHKVPTIPETQRVGQEACPEESSVAQTHIETLLDAHLHEQRIQGCRSKYLFQYNCK